MKKIDSILAPPPVHWVGDGFRVHTFFPGARIANNRMSPFFLLDYNSKYKFTPTDKPRGVGVHPHRGFETVTLAFRGKVAHHDSTGQSGIIGEGDVQWMTAASGILHKEFHEEKFSREGGIFHMVQLWVNLPAKHKMSAPKYQPIRNHQMGKYMIPDNKGVIDVIAGSYENIKGPASTFTPMHMYSIKLKAGGKVKMDFPENYNTGILVLNGSIRVDPERENVPEDHFLLFKNEGREIHIQSEKDSDMLVLSGEPINEPIASYGPFLMNTREEIQLAMDDFNNGLFGHLED